jgi:hypothetical protein
MATKTDELKKDMRRMLDDLATLRDEIRVDLHLAGMDLKDRWSALETELHKAEEGFGHDVSDNARKALDDLTARARKLGAEIKKLAGGAKPGG